MKSHHLFGALALVTLLCPVASGQTEMKGQTGPAFKAGKMLFDSDVTARSLEECQGELVLIKYWGLNCPPCKAAMPGVQRLWDEYRGKGLHVFHIESQGHSADEVTAYCEKMGYSYPQTMREGSDFGGYDGGNGLPYAFLLGSDGKVIWQGRSGYEQVIATEIAKVKYPGLGKQSVAKGAERAAELLSRKNYSAAIESAEKVMGSKSDDEGARLAQADAKYIVERALKIGQQKLEKVDSLSAAREFVLALALLRELSQGFKGHAIGEEAKQRSKSMSADEAVQKELKAEQALSEILERVKRASTPDQQKELLRAFAARFEGTRAAEKALSRAKNI